MSFNIENDNSYREEIPMNEIISTHIQLVKDTATVDYGKKRKKNNR
jgi:hypothetical protein